MSVYKLSHIYQNMVHSYSILEVDDYQIKQLSKQYNLTVKGNQIYFCNQEEANHITALIKKDNDISFHLIFLGEFHTVDVELKANKPVIKINYTALKVDGNHEILLKSLFNEQIEEEKSTIMQIDASKFKTFRHFCEYIVDSHHQLLKRALKLHNNHKYLNNIMNEKIFDENILFDAMITNHCIQLHDE